MKLYDMVTCFLRCLKSLVTKMAGILMTDFKGGLGLEGIFIFHPPKCEITISKNFIVYLVQLIRTTNFTKHKNQCRQFKV